MNVKPGDLAYIARSIHDHNIGAIVSVVKAHKQHGWWCVVSCSPLICIGTFGNTLLEPPGAKIVAYDGDLRRIAGPNVDISEPETVDRPVDAPHHAPT